MKHLPRSKAELLSQFRRQKQNDDVMLGSRLMLMICVTELYCYDGWSAEDINKFVDDVQRILVQYNQGEITLDDWLEEIKEATGLDFLSASPFEVGGAK